MSHTAGETGPEIRGGALGLLRLLLLVGFSVGLLNTLSTFPLSWELPAATGKAAGLPPPRWFNHNKRLACQMHNTDRLIEICCKKQTQNKCEITVSLHRGPLKWLSGRPC